MKPIIDKSGSPFKEYLLQSEESQKNVKMFAETKETLDKIITELTETLDHPEVTVGIGGGALFSIISYEIIEHLIKKGIKINDIIGNSGGALVGSLVATHNIKKEYVDTIFSSITLSPLKYLTQVQGIIIGLMSPFLCEFHYKGEKIELKDILVKHNNELLKELSHEKVFQNGKVPEEMIKKTVTKIIIAENMYPNNSKEDVYKNLSVHKMTFNDIKNTYGTDFKVLASVIKGKNLFKKGEDIKQDITFSGDFPVIDSLVVSSNFVPHKIDIKGKKVLAMDGYLSGNDFPFSKSHYAGHDKDKPIVLIHTPGTNPNAKKDSKLIHTYGENEYIIAPNVDAKLKKALAHIDSKNIPTIKKIARELIEGADENQKDEE